MSIEFINVDKTLRRAKEETEVLRKGQLAIADGQTAAVLAPPGMGKTTIAGLMTGQYQPTAGRVVRRGLVSFPAGAQAAFNPNLSLRENLAFLCRVYDFDTAAITRFVASFTGAGDRIDTPFRRLDREFRRVATLIATYAMPFDHYIVDGPALVRTDPWRALLEHMIAERTREAGFVFFSSTLKTIPAGCSLYYVLINMRLVLAENRETAEKLLQQAGPGKASKAGERSREEEEEDDALDF